MPYEAPGNVTLSNLPPINQEREVDGTITTANHEYEILDKYGQATYEDITPTLKPEPESETVQLKSLASTGDYEFTHCPAYVTVTTTNIHGNTNGSSETPTTQPTIAQDDP